MKLLHKPEVLAGDQPADPSVFTGPVQQKPLHSAPAPTQVRVSVVHFHDGAHTNWHRHGGGQVLHVVEGRGRVQSWGEGGRDIAAGDTVTAEPDEKHWHGAAPGADMAHLAVSMGDVTWLELVE